MAGHQAGKGSKRRPTNQRNFDAGHDAINWPSKQKAKAESVCDYVPNSNEPCADCPRTITTLYRCGLLQEAANETKIGGICPTCRSRATSPILDGGLRMTKCDNCDTTFS